MNPNNSDGSPTGTEGEEGAEVQTPFGENSPLAGMDPGTVAERFQVMQATLEAQKEQINELRRNNMAPSQAPSPQEETPFEEPVEDVSAADYWADPVKHQKKIVERAVRKHLDEVITPFKEDLARSRTSEARQQVRSEFPDFGTYEPLVNELLDRAGNTNPDVGQLRMLYYTAKGYASQHGNEPGQPSQPSQPGQQPNQRPTPASAPPQHRASNQPLKGEEGGKGKTRQLTETERASMRMFGFNSEEEYLAYKEASESDLVSVDLGGENDE